MMYIQNILAVTNLIARRPRLVTVAAANLQGRLRHRYENWRGHVGEAPPEQLTVVPTDSCNLRCHMCQFASSESPGYRLNQVGRMDPDLFRKLMDETPGRPLVSFTGGEPLLHPGVVDFVAMAHAKGCPTGLTTNGWFLAGKAKALRDAGLDMLTVSVDGPAATHNRIRGAHSFERLAAGLAEFRDMPDRPVIFVSMAISDLNCHELVEMYELAVAWGVDGLNFNHLWMQTDAVVDAFNSQFPFLFRADRVAWSVNPAEVDVRQLVDSLAAIEHRCWRAPLVVTETPFLSRHEIPRWYRQPALLVKWRTTRCAWIRLRVWPDGSVRACRELSVGSIAKDHVMDVWNGPAMRAFRKLLTAHGTVPICARCCYLPHR